MDKMYGVYKWLNSVQHTIYPPRCLLCGGNGEAGRDLCGGCAGDLPRNTGACRCCALPLQGGQEGICGACIRRAPHYAASVIPYLYAPPLDHLLLGLKFHRQLAHARLLGGMMAEAISASGELMPEAILPVPLHPSRLRERGYNQALELARPLARALQLPIAGGLVQRSLATAAQSSLQREERRRNVRGVFSAAVPLPRHIAIVDDVVTTGSTVNELARVLKRAGAERIVVWACARVP